MSNIRFFVDYFKHYLTSNSRHGVHSPFVYSLIDRVIYDFSPKEYVKPIEELRKKLKNDTRTLRITDLGAGSMLNNGKVKQISSLAKNALKPPRVAKVIARLANEFHPESIVELGTCLGITTLYLSKASSSSRIITVEGCPETAKVARENFNRLAANNIETRTGNFDVVFPEIIEELSRIDFLFIDGNHRKDATLKYFYDCLPKVHEASVLIFDDIYWSKGMKEAWQEIKNHPQVTVTIDLFYIGLVFFKSAQVKEDFKVRFR
jgi:predicted O-methyltransferase YrrM